ncbi:tyrosine-type recombinase/integrase [Amycolatopsis palatopharyngis]|uniref:tyrosine-type recombinase/integrase n=1 Tax=Amycolatopsis palatopharyngis TaxID=187982 RepID=UPI000E25D07F|nr:tyrosine-type recombinase/integrase [Amycolatopsis palatopharyngis]
MTFFAEGADTGRELEPIGSSGARGADVDARAAAELLRLDISSAVQLLPALPPPDRSDRYHPRALTVLWLVDAAANTRRGYFRDLADWLAHCERNDLDPLHARRPDIDAWKAAMTVTRRTRDSATGTVRESVNPAAPATVCRRLAAVSSWYEYLIGGDLALRNPVRGTSRPKPPDFSPLPALATEQVERFLAFLDERAATLETEVALREAAQFRLMFTTGLRVAAATSARFDELTEEAGRAALRYTKKGGQSDLVPLPETVLRACERYWKARAIREGVARAELSGPLFVSLRGSALKQRDLDRRIRALSVAAGLPELTAHSTRRSAAEVALANGATIEQIQDLLGLADIRIARRYAANSYKITGSPAYTIADALGGGGQS